MRDVTVVFVLLGEIEPRFRVQRRIIQAKTDQRRLSYFVPGSRRLMPTIGRYFNLHAYMHIAGHFTMYRYKSARELDFQGFLPAARDVTFMPTCMSNQQPIF